ncbi:hypothetical protein ScPMuIL_003427 [Solemya velum]
MCPGRKLGLLICKAAIVTLLQKYRGEDLQTNRDISCYCIKAKFVSKKWCTCAARTKRYLKIIHSSITPRVLGSKVVGKPESQHT